MATPRQHGGAALQQFPLTLPAFKGLNKQARGTLLGPEWATRLENTVLDTSNRISARQGWSKTTTVAVAADFIQLAEYLTTTGTSELIASTDTNLMQKSVNNGSTWTNVTGSAGITDSNMQLLMFNNKLLGFQSGDAVIVYTGTTFSDVVVSSGSAPAGGVALAAFGRVWGTLSDGVTIVYSALLDETKYAAIDGGGQIDMTNVWKGTDTVQALAEFNGSLVVFGKRNIVFWTDGQGSSLGIDPEQLFVSDTLTGLGCAARDSVVNVKGDLWFLDNSGVQSLGRLIAERSNPINNISQNVQDEVSQFVNLANKDNIRAVYSSKDRFYLLSIPLGTTLENGVVFCFDTRAFLEDGSARCAGIWNKMVPRCVVVKDDLSVVSGLLEKQGAVGLYQGFIDDTTRYVLEYESGWTDLTVPNLKILKRLDGLLFVQADTAVTFKWAFDFDDTFKSSTVTYPGSAALSEWGVGEWNIAEYAGGVLIKEKRVGGKGTGEYIKIGMSVNINSSTVSIQQLTLYAKEGRLR